MVCAPVQKDNLLELWQVDFVPYPTGPQTILYLTCSMISDIVVKVR